MSQTHTGKFIPETIGNRFHQNHPSFIEDMKTFGLFFRTHV